MIDRLALRLRNAAFVAMVGLACAASSSVHSQEVATAQPTREEMLAWISEMSSENYYARESATRRINRYLDATLPLVIEAAEGNQAKQIDPLLQFLGFVAAEPLSPNGARAYACLERIAQERMTHRAVVSQKILESVAMQMRGLAVARLKEVGASCDDRFLSVLTRTMEVRNALVIDSRFTGTEEDIELLKWLFDVRFVKLEGPAITKRLLERIAAMPRLESLQIIDTSLTGSDLACLTSTPDLKLLEILYTPIDDTSIPILEQIPVFGDMQLFGTKLSAAGAKDLIARIDSANVFVGRGGFLGIVCEPSSLIIREVVHNGPADRAGIRTMDKLLKVDGIPISNFDDLRRELAKSADGETVVIEYERPLVTFRRGDNRGNGPDGQRLDAYSPMRAEVILGRRPSEMSR